MKDEQLDAMVELLTSQEIPIFARSMQSITELTAQENSTFSELAREILQDASMTARVLRIANTIYYSSGLRKVSTVSRAVMVLGFDTVRSMCITAALVEGLLKGRQREQVIQEMALAFHAAVQAKRLAAARGEHATEEVFIAALLCRLGHFGFWCFAGAAADRLEAALSRDGEAKERTEEEVLGFRLQELTRRLGKEWRLSQLLERALDGGTASDPRAHCITLGYRLARASGKGWESLEVRKLLKEIGRFVKAPVEKVTEMAHESARRAAEITGSYGLDKSSRLIPQPENAQEQVVEVLQGEAAFLEPDESVEPAILQDLSVLLKKKPLDINLLLSVLLEGIYRGIGMDRVLFALLTPDRSALRGKFGFGWPEDVSVQDFVFSATAGSPNIFEHTLRRKEALWVRADSGAEIAALLTHTRDAGLGEPPFFIMPVVVQGKAIGVIYTDRHLSHRGLNQTDFEGFCRFGQHASGALSNLVP